MNIELSNKIDKKISTAVFIQFAVLTVQYFILLYFKIEGSSIGLTVKLLSKIIVGIFFLRALKDVFVKEHKLIFMVYGISIIIFLLNVLIFPNNVEIIKSIIFDFFFMCLPCFVYSYSIDSYSVLYKTIEKLSNIIFIIGLIISLLLFFNKIDIGTYSMTLSYYLLMPTLLYLYKYLNEMSNRYLLLLSLLFASILLIGARGPILCIGVYIIIFLINGIKEKNSVKKMLFYITVISLLLILIIFLKDILHILNLILENFNIYSRTMELLLTDGIHLSGRERLYSEAFRLIKENPILGVGITGDRYYLHGYVHNLFLEIILDFGLFFGLLITVLLIGVFLKTTFFINKEISSFISIFLCLGVIPLMISGSYLIDIWFWIYMGISTKYIFKIKNKYKIKI